MFSAFSNMHECLMAICGYVHIGCCDSQGKVNKLYKYETVLATTVLRIQQHVNPSPCWCVPWINYFIFHAIKKALLSFCCSTDNARPWNLTSIWHPQIAHSVSCQGNDFCKSISQVWNDALCGCIPMDTSCEAIHLFLSTESQNYNIILLLQECRYPNKLNTQSIDMICHL